MEILRDVPISVRYKEQDRYGPLSMMLFTPPTKQITRDVSIPDRREPFPEDKLPDCEAFNVEWLQRRFTKQELAQAIAGLLVEIEPPPLLEEVDDSTTLVMASEGTFLADDIFSLKSLRSIQPPPEDED